MKSTPNIYAVLMLLGSCLWLGVVLFPFAYSVIFPNEDIRNVLLALKGRRDPHPEASEAVQQAVATVGSLKASVHVASFSGVTKTYQLTTGKSETIDVFESTYIAWFEKKPGMMVIGIRRYEREGNQKAFAITEGDFFALIRGYGAPLLLVAVSVFLTFRRKNVGA